MPTRSRVLGVDEEELHLPSRVLRTKKNEPFEVTEEEAALLKPPVYETPPGGDA